MSLYCNIPLPDFEQDICANEPGRIISIALVRSDAGITDPTVKAQWNSAIAAGSVVIIKNVRGTKPKSSPVEIDSFGRQQTRTVSRDFTAQFFHPDIVSNEDFWNVANYDNAHSFWYYTQGKRIWRPAPLSEDNDALPVVNINADSIVEEGLNTSIIGDVEVSWSSKFIPVSFAAPNDIFE